MTLSLPPSLPLSQSLWPPWPCASRCRERGREGGCLGAGSVSISAHDPLRSPVYRVRVRHTLQVVCPFPETVQTSAVRGCSLNRVTRLYLSCGNPPKHPTRLPTSCELVGMPLLTDPSFLFQPAYHPVYQPTCPTATAVRQLNCHCLLTIVTSSLVLSCVCPSTFQARRTGKQEVLRRTLTLFLPVFRIDCS